MSVYANADGTSRETGLYAGADGAVRALLDTNLIHDMNAVSISSETDISEFSFVYASAASISKSGYLMAICIFPKQRLSYSLSNGDVSGAVKNVMTNETIKLQTTNALFSNASITYDSVLNTITFKKAACVGWR